MSGTTSQSKTFYIPVGDMSIEKAFEIAKKFKKNSYGVIKLKEK